MLIDIVETANELRASLAKLPQTIVGIDVERADSRNYYRRASLVQVGAGDYCALIDVLALPEPSLANFLRDRLAILHAIDNDLVPLERCGIDLPLRADTAVAAAMLGRPRGLTPLLADVLDIELDHDKQRMQRADWAKRPMTEDMTRYAADDVVHLPELWTVLHEELHERGRLHWYEQELDATIERATSNQRAWYRIKGAGRLTPQGRAILREVWAEREEIAQANDIAPQRLLRDETLLSIAAEPPKGATELVRRTKRSRAGRHAAELHAAVERGLASQPLDHDARPPRTDGDEAAADAVRLVRNEVAEELGLEAGVLATTSQLRTAALANPSSAAELAEAAVLRPWQVEVLGDRLWEAYAEAIGDD